MAEYFVAQQRDMKIGDTWASSGVFGLNIGGSMDVPDSCPICGMPAQTCIGDARHGTTTEAPEDVDLPEAA